MSFSTFSGEFTAHMFTSVENQFITKYLPQADGDAVRVYLYGLYLCQCAEDFDAESCAKLLRLTPEKLLEIYSFWEECDLVHILSRNPLYVQYLPVNPAVGKPKPVRAEKYAEFNREFYKQLQRAGKEFKPYEMQRIFEFLESSPMEQQAFLLVSEYCVKKDGEKLSAAHVLNKAKKLCAEHKYTYEQVERELADFNAHEKELSRVFALLGIYRKIQENDYAFLEKWLGYGTEPRAIYACAEKLGKGTLSTLDALVTELHERDVHTAAEAKEYLARREELTSVVFKVGSKLGVKIQNPRAYAEEYAEKWLERGYDEESLTLVASLAFKLRYGFAETDALLDTLYAAGIVDGEGVKAYCTERDGELRLLQKIQTICGVVKKTQSALDMVSAWKSWRFSDEMIAEAAKRSTNAASPLPYMNKLLSEWKRTGVFAPEAIPAPSQTQRGAQNAYRNEAAIAADQRSDRERYYSLLRARALEKAEKAQKRAAKDEAFRTADAALKKGEIELARAEVFSPNALPALRESLTEWKKKRADALSRLKLSEEDFLPRFQCAKCSDTGFLPDGRMCDCYRE
ncbi:MAG: hypothetical protein ACI4NG_05220 [Candidatus Gallimonas sp.]